MRTLFFLLFCFTPLFLNAAELKILKPDDRGKTYDIAAAEFQKYYKLCTGKELPIITEPNDADSLVVIGSDAVNRFCRDCIEQKKMEPFQIRTGTDDYELRSLKDGSRDLLFLAGGRGRSALYAVYHFFEKQGNCSYFWDGDVIPKSETLDITGLNIKESPRFEYRGLRYFAHRSLHRFQAEHWGPKDWEQEIDWIVKKRLNVFMLRIGMDDIFQKAFPDIVPYPDNDKPIPEAGEGYDDRTPSWSLKYRGELRKHILQYAFDRELMHPEDFGTMTHWYSRTPMAFLEKVKPEFLAQSGGGYKEQTGLVWDIRNDKMLDLYFKLTKTHVEEYGKPELFHTIGLAERRMFKDKKDNLEIKLYTYRRLIAKLLQEYPNAKILLAGWDFFSEWTPDEVPQLLKELNPENTIIWDYEADSTSERNFTNWNLVGKFPYIFGIFEALEASADIRANYDIIAKRIDIAAKDPLCKGYIFWPEMSHADILMLEYFPHNAWNPDEPEPLPAAERLCKTRYRSDADVMLKAWKLFVPMTYPYPGEWFNVSGLWHYPAAGVFFSQRDWAATRKIYADKLPAVSEMYKVLADAPFADDKPFVKRDALDLARTIAGRMTVLAVCHLNIALKNWKDGKATEDDVRREFAAYQKQLETFRDILSLHPDYSMTETFEGLKTVNEVNPCFAKTLLNNAGNGYCASFQYEMFEYFYLPLAQRYKAAVESLLTSPNEAKKIDTAALAPQFTEARTAFLNTPLAEMKAAPERTAERYKAVMLQAASSAETLLNAAK
ncbi:MAG: hypothetical protein LBN39_00060 [Planctomycetaceae bacterium]|nr:hypothetical protein [Planctomycetaceae bacterium]